MTKLRLSWPNRITLARILLTGPFVMAMLHVNDPAYMPWIRYVAIVIFLVMAVSDGLDGWLARRTKEVTQLGAFLDPLADKLLIICSTLLLAGDKTAVPGMRLPDVVVVVIIGKDLYTIMGFFIIYMITSEMKIVPVLAGKTSTAMQLVTVLAILISPEATELVAWYPYVVKFLWWTMTVMGVITVIIYTRNGTRYVNEYEAVRRANNHKT
ncbi:MAG: CDP-alcohol phosphatidyltransferase family protein [Sedimentisphaerales bacterium]|nr:CDP-alcohol phosphatidyltransferase family protein [Sedimentisphaerales bacterium]